MLGPFNTPNADETGFYVPFYASPVGPAQPAPLAAQFATVVVKPHAGQRADLLANALRREVAKADPNLPLYFVGTPKSQSDAFVAANRIIATMFTIFGAAAIVLASVGIYGVMSFAVTQRTQEFGVRMALGAPDRRILAMVLGQGVVQIAIGLALGFGALVGITGQKPHAASFGVVEAGIPEMRDAMAKGRVTSRELVAQYLMRIATYDQRVHAVLAVNPRALAEADALDRERAAGRLRGPLHGIPVALKDNIHTTDMPTTGGALAFAGYVPPYEATLVTNLKAAGAILIAKTGMTELANWVAGAPTPMPTNYNAVGGFGFNPYDPRRDPRILTFDGRPALQTGGSSSGVGPAGSFWGGNGG